MSENFGSFFEAKRPTGTPLISSTTSSTTAQKSLLELLRSVDVANAPRGLEKAAEAKKLLEALEKTMTKSMMENMLAACKTLPFGSFQDVYDRVKKLMEAYIAKGSRATKYDDLLPGKNLNKAYTFVQHVADTAKKLGINPNILSWDAVASYKPFEKMLSDYMLECLKSKDLGRGLVIYSKLPFMVLSLSDARKLMSCIWAENLKTYFSVSAAIGDAAFNPQDIIKGIDTLQKPKLTKPTNATKKLNLQGFVDFKAWMAYINNGEATPLKPYELTYPSLMLLKQTKDSRKEKREDADASISMMMYTIQWAAFGKATTIKSLDKDDEGIKVFFDAHKKVSFALRYLTKSIYGEGQQSRAIRTLVQVKTTIDDNFKF